MPDDLGVKSIPSQPDARVAQEVGSGLASPPDTGADSKQRKVTGSSAEVADQDELVLIERGFVFNYDFKKSLSHWKKISSDF